MENGTKSLDLSVKEGGVTPDSKPVKGNPGGGGGVGVACCVGCIGTVNCTNS